MAQRKDPILSKLIHLVIQANYLATPTSSFAILLKYIINFAIQSPEIGKITLLETHLLGPAIDTSTFSGHEKLVHKRLRFPAGWAEKLGSLLPFMRVESLVPGADVFFCIHHYPSPVAVKAANVAVIHDLTPLIFPDFSPLQPKWFIKRIRTMQNRADRIVVVSEFSHNDLEKHLGFDTKRMTTIHNAVDSRFVPVDADRKRLAEQYGLNADYILYLGTIGHQKNVVTLINAFAEISGEFPNLLLALAGGEGKGIEQIRRTIGQYKLANRVRFVGRIPTLEEGDDLVHLYSGAKLFATASLYEGFGLPPLEAMACGTPVISSNAASLPEVVEQAGILVPPLDANGFAKAFRRILTDEKYAAILSKKGLQRASRFSVERMGRAYIELFRTLVENRRASK